MIDQEDQGGAWSSTGSMIYINGVVSIVVERALSTQLIIFYFIVTDYNTLIRVTRLQQCSPNTIRIVFGGSPIKVVRLIGDFSYYSNTIRDYYSNNHVLSTRNKKEHYS